MRKIIEGKVYDTHTAELVGKHKGEKDSVDNQKALYRKRTGEYFVAVQDPQTKEGTISPYTYTAARNWAKNHLSKDIYKKAFGTVTEARGREDIRFNVVLPMEVHEKLKRRQEETGKSMSAIAAEILEKHL